MSALPIWLQAAFWGGLAGSALLLGAAAGLTIKLPQRLIAGIMAFGAGVLIAALSFELMDEAWRRDGFGSLAIGFVVGAIAFTAGNLALSAAGARHRKRSGQQMRDEDASGGALALGALLDGIPESIVIGVSLIGGGGVSVAAVVAVFLSNVPEGLASATGMKKAGYRSLTIMALWAAIAVASAAAAALGAAFLSADQPSAIAFVQALAAGAILAMVIDTMAPEAFERTHAYTGLISVAGFLTSFWLTKLGE